MAPGLRLDRLITQNVDGLHQRAGSSVMPAASLAALAERNGARLVIVNAGPAPYDDLADEVIRDPIGEAVPRLVARLIG